MAGTASAAGISELMGDMVASLKGLLMQGRLICIARVVLLLSVYLLAGTCFCNSHPRPVQANFGCSADAGLQTCHMPMKVKHRPATRHVGRSSYIQDNAWIIYVIPICELIDQGDTCRRLQRILEGDSSTLHDTLTARDLTCCADDRKDGHNGHCCAPDLHRG